MLFEGVGVQNGQGVGGVEVAVHHSAKSRDACLVAIKRRIRAGGEEFLEDGGKAGGIAVGKLR